MNNNVSLRKDIFDGVPQGSILDPLMFHIYINDTCLFADNAFLSNYADDTALYSTGENHNTKKNILNKNFFSPQKHVFIKITWF